MYVYRLCLVSHDEISFDEGFNTYHVVNYTNGQPARPHGPRGPPLLARPPIQINVSANFVHPRDTNELVEFVTLTNGYCSTSTIPNPQVIPVVNVVQPADLSAFPKMLASAKTSLQGERGVYIGPVHAALCSYLTPCTYNPFVGFNARILQTCKTIHAEALPILYSKNRFVLHSQHWRHQFSKRSAVHLIHLRLGVDYPHIVIDKSGSNNLWSTVLRQCKQLRTLTLSFGGRHSYQSVDYTGAVIRAAANIANVKKGTGQPKMVMRAILKDVQPSAYQFSVSSDLISQTRSIIAKKTHPKLQVPRGTTLEIMGSVEKEQLLLVQEYTRKGWRFRRKLPENDSELEPGTWVELEWVKSQE